MTFPSVFNSDNSLVSSNLSEGNFLVPSVFNAGNSLVSSIVNVGNFRVSSVSFNYQSFSSLYLFSSCLTVAI